MRTILIALLMTLATQLGAKETNFYAFNCEELFNGDVFIIQNYENKPTLFIPARPEASIEIQSPENDVFKFFDPQDSDSQNMDAHQLILVAWGEFFKSFRTDTERRLLNAVELGLRSLEMEEATETYGLLAFSYCRLAGLTKNKLYFEKALQISELGLDFDPSGDLIYRALGFIEFELRPQFESVQLNKDAILKYYEKSIYHNPSDSNSYSWKALSYAKFGAGEKAVKSAQRAIELSPTIQGWECWPYALAYYSTRDFERMLEYARQGQCKEYASLATYQLAQKNLALQLYQQYVENYERQYNNTFSFKHLENQEYFAAKEDDLEFKRKLKVVHDSWLTEQAN